MTLDVLRSVPLAPKTSLELGGAAALYAEARSESDVVEAARMATQEGHALTVLGGGTNVVVSDDGVPGLVLAMRTTGIEKRMDGDFVVYDVAAGEIWDDFVATTLDEGRSGLECLSGIPGRIGATPIQNVGAYGAEVADTVTEVRALDRATGEVVSLDREACAFQYRHSRFKEDSGRYIVLRVTFRLSRGKPKDAAYPELQKALETRGKNPSANVIRETVLGLRRAKSMVLDPNDENRRSVGSFFLNPIVTRKEAARIAQTNDGLPRYEQADGRVKMAAGWLIENSGIKKGMRRGHVGISTRHALQLVHHGGGRAEELVTFAREIRNAVRTRFGVTLVPEPSFLGFPEGFF